MTGHGGPTLQGIVGLLLLSVLRAVDDWGLLGEIVKSLREARGISE